MKIKPKPSVLFLVARQFSNVRQLLRRTLVPDVFISANIQSSKKSLLLFYVVFDGIKFLIINIMLS